LIELKIIYNMSLTIFCGVDKTGKSTIARVISEKLGGEIQHYSKPNRDPYEYFYPALEAAKTKIVVCDRHLLGERIYSKIKKEPSQWKEGDYERMLKQLGEMHAVICIVWEYKELLKKRHAELREDYITADEMIKVQRLFLKEARRIAEEYPGITVLTYKPTSNLIRLLGKRV